ncbi:MAG: 2'-5' RNA ligase family protein [Christensenellaceae bacterium]|jgi:2'-5' RNA ligase|nr:2'-5' RNA ligase family protein [Christensenellaceae bacterium]
MPLPISIELHFDPQSTAPTQAYIEQAAETSGNDYMPQHRIPPHLTLAFFGNRPIGIALEQVVARKGLFRAERLVFPVIAAFVPSMLFLVPKQSECLAMLNHEICTGLGEIASPADPFYLPKSWVPHRSIAVRLECVR